MSQQLFKKIEKNKDIHGFFLEVRYNLELFKRELS